jgi:hypothetical protein
MPLLHGSRRAIHYVAMLLPQAGHVQAACCSCSAQCVPLNRDCPASVANGEQCGGLGQHSRRRWWIAHRPVDGLCPAMAWCSVPQATPNFVRATGPHAAVTWWGVGQVGLVRRRAFSRGGRARLAPTPPADDGQGNRYVHVCGAAAVGSPSPRSSPSPGDHAAGESQTFQDEEVPGGRGFWRVRTPSKALEQTLCTAL